MKLTGLIWLVPAFLLVMDIIYPFPSRAGRDDVPPTIERTILISLDSCGAEVFHRNLPRTAAYFAAAGTVFESVATCVAAETMSGHTVMLTGCTSGTTGILGNGLYLPGEDMDIAVVQDPKYRNSRTVFEHLADSDATLSTAFISGKWRLPRFLSQEAGMVFSSPASGYPIPPRYREAVGLPVSNFEGDAYDLWTGRVLSEVVRQDDPELVFANFAWLDRAGHDTGERSFNTRRMHRMLDGIVIQMITDLSYLGLLETTLLVVTADHGMDTVYGYVNPLRMLEENGITVSHIHAEGHCGFIYLADPDLADRARDLLEAHPRIQRALSYDDMDSLGFKAARIRTGDVWFSLEGGYTVDFAGLPMIFIGMHGGLVTRDVPLAFSGPGIPVVKRVGGGTYGLEDVVPTLYALWGAAAPEGMEGRTIDEIVEN